jgi:hypothetical protein
MNLNHWVLLSQFFQVQLFQCEIYFYTFTIMLPIFRLEFIFDEKLVLDVAEEIEVVLTG